MSRVRLSFDLHTNCWGIVPIEKPKFATNPSNHGGKVRVLMPSHKILQFPHIVFIAIFDSLTEEAIIQSTPAALPQLEHRQGAHQFLVERTAVFLKSTGTARSRFFP